MELPQGSFKASGTAVNTVMVVAKAPDSIGGDRDSKATLH